MRILDQAAGLSEFLRGGREKAAEDMVIKLFGKQLDDRFTMLRNLVMPGTGEKMGLVLVGPGGAWHIEIPHLASLSQNGPVWMYWDYGQQSIQVVPFAQLATQARSRLAEFRAYLAPEGIPGYQVVMVPVANIPREFDIPGVEKFVFVEDLRDFIRDEIAESTARTPVNVGRAIDLLTGKAHRPEAAAAPASGGRSWLKKRYRQYGGLTGQQLLLVGLFGVANLCLLVLLAAVFLVGG